MDVASRYKEAEPLATKESTEVTKAFSNIYKRVLKWPKLLQVDPGRKFMGEVNKVMKAHNVKLRRGEKALHRAQAIVERFCCTLAEKLFGHQYHMLKNFYQPQAALMQEVESRLLDFLA